MEVLQRLVEGGNTLLVIEHNLDVMKCADWIIDLGPEGGVRGGQVVAVGTPEQVAAHPTSYTGAYLAKVPGIVPEEVKAVEVVGAEKVKKRPGVASSADLDKKPRKKAATRNAGWV